MRGRAPDIRLCGQLALPVLRAVEDASHRRELLRLLGVSEAALEGPDTRITHAQWVDLLRTAVALTHDTALAVRAARRSGTDHMDLVGHLAKAQPTVREAHAAASRFLPLFHEGMHIELITDGDRAVCRLAFAPGLARSREVSEFMLCWWVEFGRLLFGEDHAPSEVRFRDEPPADLAVHRAVLRAPLVFGAAHDEVVFPAGVLDARIPSADRGLEVLLNSHAQRQLATVARSDSLENEVRRIVRASLADGAATMPAIAAALRMTERTLRRRLREQGTTFEHIVDEVRRDVALDYVASAKRRTGRGVVEIAFLLGYGDETAFYRAFRRWTGRTPQEYARRGDAP